jgi:hypothetical protein
MSGNDWSREEVEATVQDYLEMTSSWLAGTSFNKAAHRRALQAKLNDRSEKSVEFKYRNISAALIDADFPYIPGYTPLFNYQGLLAEVLMERLSASPTLLAIAAADADAPIVVPEVQDILAVLAAKPKPPALEGKIRENVPLWPKLTTNYVEREARNRSLGLAGEKFVINFERARLVFAGKDSLAAKIEHTSMVKGDYEGYDILSFEESGAERLIEVKTTKYGLQTPFFVSRNEVETSERHSHEYQVYRLFEFRAAPRLYTLTGSIDASCQLSAATYLARPK